MFSGDSILFFATMLQTSLLRNLCGNKITNYIYLERGKPVSRDPLSHLSRTVAHRHWNPSIFVQGPRSRRSASWSSSPCACWAPVLLLLGAVISRSGFAKETPHLDLLKVSSERPQPHQDCPTSQCKNSYKERVCEQPPGFLPESHSFSEFRFTLWLQHIPL